MNQHGTSLRLISSVGKKGPACFLVEAGGNRLVLDLGEGPPPGCLPDLDNVGRVDALIVTHGHKDHVGGLGLLPKLGNPPIYATEIVLAGLPDGLAARTLPLRGRSEVLGIAVETGRNGHAPGGVWVHLDIGGGLLYTGDYSAESVLYAYDPPDCIAATALVDCSYGAYQKPSADCWTELALFVAKTPILLPVPANGRGPEIALELLRHGFRDIFIDEAMRNAVRLLCDGGKVSLHAGLAGEVERLTEIARPVDGPHGIMLAASADGTSGASAHLLPQFEDIAEVEILFTGYINPDTPAERLSKSGRAQRMRWNVHPRLSDTVALVRNVKAETVIPAFCDRSQLGPLAAALAPARVTVDEVVMV